MSPLSLDRAPASGRNAYLAMIPQLEEQGFLRIPIDGAVRQSVDHVFTLANEFFKRPAAEKQHYSNAAWVEGYRELGPEYSQVPERPDLTESFSAWNRNRARPELEGWAASCPLHGAMREASTVLGGIVRDLFAAMRDYYKPGAPDLLFHDATYVQLNYYEPARHTRELLQDSHEDGHLITLVSTNAPGLEIQVNGEFVPAEVGRDELLVMPSVLLSLMTGFRVKPLYHQVRNSHRKDPRCSLLNFVNPEITQKLEPWVVNDSNRGIDIIERAIAAPKQFGNPDLEDTLSGHSTVAMVDPHVTEAAQ
ncbi:MAG: 2-oxoglutarate and iron-dependent oxygenase domain-containing protein [Dongiaceae bacterium]